MGKTLDEKTGRTQGGQSTISLSRIVKKSEHPDPAVFTGPLSAVLCLDFALAMSHSPTGRTLTAEVDRRMEWKTLLAYSTGSVDQELLIRHEYLVTENRLLRQQITGRVRLSDGERRSLAEIGKKLGKQALEDIAMVVTPDTILRSQWRARDTACRQRIYDALSWGTSHQGGGNIVLFPGPR